MLLHTGICWHVYTIFVWIFILVFVGTFILYLFGSSYWYMLGSRSSIELILAITYYHISLVGGREGGGKYEWTIFKELEKYIFGFFVRLKVRLLCV